MHATPIMPVRMSAITMALQVVGEQAGADALGLGEPEGARETVDSGGDAGFGVG